ncbi:Bug family tripartite tricarboxylate transporter substrate binding protein [Azohydromonas lata]|uniref:Tripartite tricarboxylate transporter substrate binding protein n=1 Tax=Azohydromonas lata TaxID=45677 RepID=A0ABU5ICA0_9BURK|nr:tripartite tricarboxylate transporter substrate binding protein [Azohydromonas lata]MDZ5456748.1 tripartite tricarboxylate transporter substrate binding protein [Azohydromonas lata]
MIRRTLLAATLCAALPLAAHAQAKSTRIVVSFPPGGPVDFVARVLAEQLGKELGQTVIVDNKAGANGAIGAGEVMRSKADGSTLWITSVGAAAINASLYEKLPYDTIRDFTPVSVIVNNVELLVVSPADPAKDAAEFMANAKKSKNPVTLASSGIGSIPHLAMEQLKDSTKVDLLHVPYKGAAPAITDVMGGQVSAFFGDIPGLITFVRSGKLKPVGIASTKRHPALTEVKTLAEQGIANVDTNNWYALFAPAKTPAATVTALNDAVRRALSQPSVKAKLMDVGAEPAPSTPAELAALLKRDTDKWGKLIQDKKIKVE